MNNALSKDMQSTDQLKLSVIEMYVQENIRQF